MSDYDNGFRRAQQMYDAQEEPVDDEPEDETIILESAHPEYNVSVAWRWKIWRSKRKVRMIHIMLSPVVD